MKNEFIVNLFMEILDVLIKDYYGKWYSEYL